MPCAHQGMNPLTLSIHARKDGAVPPRPRRSHPLAIASCRHSPHLVSAHLCHLLTGHLLLLMLLLQLLRFSSSHPHLLACSKRCSVLLLLRVLLLCCQLSQHARPWHQTVVRCRAWHAIWRAAEEGRCVGVLSSQGPAKQRQLVDENSNTRLHTRGIAHGN